jgi:endonuclease/exonuclease/phosphatase family metal-dependent hydrolase
VGGDFNDWRGLVPQILIELLDLRCAGSSRETGTIRTYPSFSPTGSLDRIFYRHLHLLAARRCRLPLSRVASDHLPVIADFEL